MMLQTIDGKIQNLINKGISLEKKNRFDDAFDVYVEATKLGSTIAYCKMGWLYRRGCLSTGRDIGAAHDCFEKAAKQNDPEGYWGLYCLGNQYVDDNAERCLIKATKMGYKPAIKEYKKTHSGQDIEEVIEKEKKLDEVELLYKESKELRRGSFLKLLDLAEHDNAKACYYMGLFIQEAGKTENHKKLYTRWYEKSEELGYKKSKEKLRTIAGYSKNKENICPRCGRGLVIRPGNNGGYFKGCSGYPACRYTTPVSTPYYGNKEDMTEIECFMIYKEYKT